MALHSALKDELACLEQVVALLKKEQEVLASARIDQLSDITNNKTRLVAELENFSAVRLALMQTHNIPDDGSAIAGWLATHAPSSLDLWKTLIDLARQAAAYNRSNGQLLSGREEANRNLMRILLAEQDAETGYSADGRISHSSTRRPLDRA
ncbi:flagella synthesis protein FlgN [Formivibrio citricus]|nr:flagellar protein FlgN [Formivibrio citricus]